MRWAIVKQILLGWFLVMSFVNLAEAQPHFNGKRFFNPFPEFEQRSLGDLLKWMVWDRLTGKRPKDDLSRYHFEMRAEHQKIKNNPQADFVAWIGHSTVFLRLDGVNILTDPIFSERCSPFQSIGPKRLNDPGIPLDSLPPIELVLISHDHYDHLDKNTVLKLGNKPLYVVPLGVGAILRSWGITHWVELDWWQSHRFKNLTITCTPAQHFSGRTPFDRNSTLWAGWVVSSSQRTVYYAGDTGYFPGFAEIGKRLGPIHLAILPIGAYRPRWFMKPVHMDPVEAVQAYLDLKANIFVPVHWGTFKLADEAMDEPPKILKQQVRKLQLNSENFWLLKHGEARELQAVGQPLSTLAP